MDKRRAILNVGSSILSRGILVITALLVRRLLIQQLGNDVNGLNSLFTSIMGMLAVAELGIGRAIVYSMYYPIVKGDKSREAALFGLYKRVYLIIGFAILFGGLMVLPFFPLLISDYEVLTVNVYSNFFLMLISVVLTYFFSAKTSLIEAHKDNYIATAILTFSSLTRYALQAISLLILKSFSGFLICQIISTLMVWGLTEIVVWRKYFDIITMKVALELSVRKEIVRNVRAMFLHKLGTIMVNSVDNLIISVFIGVIVLGKYNNYTFIAGVISGTITLFFSPLTSIVGHFCIIGDKEKAQEYFEWFYSLNYILGVIFFLGYAA